MTREEAIDIFEHNWTRLENHDYTDEELNKALTMAIKALEQQPKTDVLDKIRAEIESVIQEETVMDSCGAISGCEHIESKLDPDDVFQIIEKYKAESEG